MHLTEQRGSACTGDKSLRQGGCADGGVRPFNRHGHRRDHRVCMSRGCTGIPEQADHADRAVPCHYKSSADYKVAVDEQIKLERALLERIGLLKK